MHFPLGSEPDLVRGISDFFQASATILTEPLAPCGCMVVLAAATFVLEGHYHRHIRRMRQTYQRNLALYTCWIREYFPCEICITRPKGGFLLWIELPEQVDMVCVARQLCRMKIQVAAGSIFSASGKYRNCLRINCALPLSETYREALKQIGEAVYRAME